MEPTGGPRPGRRDDQGRADQRRRARHQGRRRWDRLRDQGPAGAPTSARCGPTTTPARRSTSCTGSACGSSAGSSTSSTRSSPSWAWENGRPEMIVLDGSGSEPLANDYGTAAFTNFANPKVRQYHIDLAREAVRARLRRDPLRLHPAPRGRISTRCSSRVWTCPPTSRSPASSPTPRPRWTALGAMLGVSIFGISASRPEPTAQDVRLLAPLVDYISPMVYPGLWNSGEYGVESPVRQPAEIVTASLKDFELLAAGTDAAVRPWLQDFSARGVTYGAARGAGADRRRAGDWFRRLHPVELQLRVPRRGVDGELIADVRRVREQPVSGWLSLSRTCVRHQGGRVRRPSGVEQLGAGERSRRGNS